MTEHAENLILEHLKAIRRDQSTMRSDLHDVRLRVSSVESHAANIVSDVLRINVRLDTIGDRMERIEHRLDLQD
jgi:predicted  nucleic acid-binding Zn-ribbon protein